MKTRVRKSTGKSKKPKKENLWDPGRPQPAVEELIDRGEIRGSVLEVDCGTGDNVLYLAEHGHEAWGIDWLPHAIHRAKEKAVRRRLQAVFQVADPLRSPHWGVNVDNILDCGLFPTLKDNERIEYERALSQALRPRGHFFLLWPSNRQPRKGDPRLLHKEIRRTFAKNWHINYIYPTRIRSRLYPRGADGWLASLSHTAPTVGVMGGPQTRTLPRISSQDAVPGSHHLELQPQSIAADQHCENWCWAASLQMLAKSQGIDLPQEWFVKKIYGPQKPCWPSGSFENIQQAIDGVSEVVNGTKVTLSGAFHYGIPTDPAGMIKAIQDQRPFIFGYNGHAYVCYGLTWMEQAPYVRVIELNLIDPLWKLVPDRPELTTFNVFRDSLLLINGTFELLVNKQQQ